MKLPLQIALLFALLLSASCGKNTAGTEQQRINLQQEIAAPTGPAAAATTGVESALPRAGEGGEPSGPPTPTPLPEARVQFAKPWTGDLDGMEERRVIRVLTVYGPGRYFLDRAGAKGVVAELMRMFEDFINDRFDRGHVRVHVVVIPVARDQLIPALLAGRGDLIAAGLTITPERTELVDFTRPISKPVSEIMVTGPKAPPLEQIEDLAGETVHVRYSSSYRESLEALNTRFSERGLPPVQIEYIDEVLEDDDLVEMVAGGLLPWAVVDDYKTQLWEGVFDDLVMRKDIVINSGARLAWAIRKDSPLLMQAANEFLKTHREGTLLGNILRNRYIRDFDWAAHALDDADYQRFKELVDYFERYGEKYGIEYLLAAAQGYQESRLDQSKRSHAGAVGIMQLLPSTAADPVVGIPDISNPDNNIHAGIKYLRFIRERYFSDPEIDDLNQTLLALAAYNAGPARVRGLRAQAEAEGYDPNVWFDNVEIIAAADIGRETVEYVANIYKYYLTYRVAARSEVLRHEAREAMGLD